MTQAGGEARPGCKHGAIRPLMLTRSPVKAQRADLSSVACVLPGLAAERVQPCLLRTAFTPLAAPQFMRGSSCIADIGYAAGNFAPLCR